MSIKKIEWKNHERLPKELQGFVNDQEVFTIKPMNKNADQWSLVSWGFKNDTFNNSSSSKSLGIFLDIEVAKDFAEQKWLEFVNNLMLIESN